MSESAPSRSAAGDRTTPAEGDPAPAGDDPLSRRPATDGFAAGDTPDMQAPDTAAGPTVRLLLETADVDPPVVGWLEAMLRELAVRAGVRGGELTVLAVDDAKMSEMHEQYAGVPGTTDVLTFDLSDDVGPTPNGPAVVEGDIVVCLDEARRQADARGHAPRVEALLYALHGLLHLLGEDDHDEQAYQRMHAREDQLLQAVGLGAVFGRQGEAS
ncbi:rRNA maturation RNase YbeY [Phycisphaerales bacterium AB-hyl4]|uniref:Endoribonuclease YbeY n=1 Tax=Natronomicrosphaera hydrolytica TaxID=3242702 RepID=A0ABV4U4A0_9BACT